MKKICALTLLLLSGCSDPGGFYPEFKCVERDIPTGLCTKAEYSCAKPVGSILAYYRHDSPRCK